MGKVVQNPIFRVAVGVGLMMIPGMQMMGAKMAFAMKAIGANILLGEAAKLLAPKPRKNPVNPQTVSMRGTMLPGMIVYGETRTAGMVYIPKPGTSGAGRKYLHYVVVLASHECEIGDVWFDNALIASASIDGSGSVTSGKFATKALIEKYLGTAAQTASATLIADIPAWTSDHRGRGICYLHVRMERDQEAYSSGPPQNIFAMVKGRRVYDPRTGLTAWSDNPALCLRDYLVTYCGSTVNETLVSAAANICDETVAVPGGTQKRYRCSGVLSTGAEPVDNINALLSAMSGTMTFAGGNFRMFAGAYDAPTQTIDDSWLAGAAALQITTPGNQLYNIVRAQYIDPARNFQEVEAEVQSDSAFQTIDGRELEQSMQLPFTPNEYQAQRQSFLSLNMSRGQRIMELPLNMRALNLHVWDTVNVNLPKLGVNEVYRVMSWRYSDNAPVSVVLREESAGFYQAPTAYLTATTAGAGETVSESPNAPTNLTIVPGTGGTQLAWTNPPSRQFDQIEIWRSADSVFGNAALLATVRASSYFDVLLTSATYFYWIRARNDSGQFSDYIPEITEAGSGGGTAPPPPTGGALGVTLSVTSIYHEAANNTVATTRSATCLATGGTGPYTYAWTRVSGSADITASTSTAASTTFTAPSAAATTKESVWKCTVTDSVPTVLDSPTATVTIRWKVMFEGGG